MALSFLIGFPMIASANDRAPIETAFEAPDESEDFAEDEKAAEGTPAPAPPEAEDPPPAEAAPAEAAPAEEEVDIER